MKLITLNKIIDGMVLARNIYTRKGNVLLVKDACLKASYVHRLSEWGVNAVYVIDKQGDVVEIDEELYLQAKNSLFQLVQDFCNELDEELLPPSLKLTVDRVIHQVLSDDQVLRSMVEIRAINENAFRHLAMNSIFSILLGNSAGMDLEPLIKMAEGTILLNIGQKNLAKKLLSHLGLHRENLTSPDQQPEGQERLYQFHGDYENAARIVLERYESCDDETFPQELPGSQDFQQISPSGDSPRNKEWVGPNGTKEGSERTRLFSNEAQLPDSMELKEWKCLEIASNSGYHPNFPLFEQVISILGNFSDGFQEFKSLIESAEVPKHAALKKQDENHKDAVSDNLNLLVDKGNERLSADRQLHDNYHRRNDLPRNPCDSWNNRFLVTPEQYCVTQSEALMVIKQELAKLNPEFISPQVIETTRITLGDLLANTDLVNDLVTIQALDGAAFYHSLSVNTLSVMVGASMGYTPIQLKKSGIERLWVESGKMQIARKYHVGEKLFENSPSNPWILQAANLSFERLWKLKTNPEVPELAISQEHGIEPYHGAAPDPLRDDNLHTRNLAEIVALSDAYFVLIHEGINGQKLMPHEVIEYIRDCYSAHFNPEVRRFFLQSITPFLIGSHVLLNNGEKGKVLKVNQDFLARPIIQVLYDQNGRRLPKSLQRDLRKDLTLFIVSALRNDEFDQ
jgi:HD-GYP domain-containing protein (c-di-GMP phosphodiesterase class II)